jgi:hypothetical protein
LRGTQFHEAYNNAIVCRAYSSNNSSTSYQPYDLLVPVASGMFHRYNATIPADLPFGDYKAYDDLSVDGSCGLRLHHEADKVTRHRERGTVHVFNILARHDCLQPITPHRFAMKLQHLRCRCCHAHI